MKKFERFEDIEVWQKSRVLVKDVYEILKREEFRTDSYLKYQVRRSSGSVMDNIVEGYERDGNKEFIHFLSVAKGSSGELRSQLYSALDLGYISVEEHKSLCMRAEEISRMLFGLMKYLKDSELKGMKFK